jgi:folate-dependent phosphoribosylglycinamide formyltransferase PurN
LLKPEAGRGTTYEIVACVTSDPECQELHSLQRAGIPARILDIRQFYRSRGLRWTDLSARPLFDELLAETLASYRPNLVVLCGYLHVVSDLAIRDPSGLPRYRGLRAVLDAILAGERETRSTVHLVTPELDAGPIVLRSRAFPVHHMIEEARSWGAMDILKAYAYAHREWMMRASWGELLARAIELCAEGLLPEPSLEVTVESNLAQQGG